MTFPATLLERASQVRLFVSDIDGVWTDGRITVHADGTESTTFSVQDGLGVVRLLRSGLEIAVISGRKNPAVEHRARRLGIKEIHLGSLDKGPLIRSMMEARGLKQEQVATIGDDLPDLSMFCEAGLNFAPPSSVSEVRKRADWITRASAGHGALREACNLLFEARSNVTTS
ncbi:MAG: HAD-IIIA family hydrolase [Planctomycetota bacterium]|nr:HAD-IIIA family hydrolase [Planctomycetota bacterium]MDA1113428.1 HAD-IIIA family hydrolase [Planctomycetota bacterium]